MQEPRFKLLNVLQRIILEYLCPLDTPDAVRFIDNAFQNNLIKWTISRQTRVPTHDFNYSRARTTICMPAYDVCMVGEQVHCVNGPAFTCKSSKYWVLFGKLHRDDDGPSIEYFNGDKEWYCKGELYKTQNLLFNDAKQFEERWFKDGKTHRDGAPAYSSPDVTMWYQYGQIHRIGGPAYENKSVKRWYENDKLHRVDGPAIVDETIERRKEWFLFGKRHRHGGPAIEQSKNKEWYCFGKLHRSDGPAIERENGTKKWLWHGKLHRTNDLPAIEWANGTKEWYYFGKLHRVNGPASVVVKGDGEYRPGKRWYKHGVEFMPSSRQVQAYW